MNINMKNKWLPLLLTACLASCSTTKNLPEGEVLYTGIKQIKAEQTDNSVAGKLAQDEVEAALEYAPNNALLGSSSIRTPIPFGLWVYNSFVNSKGGLGKWIFDKLASKPVLISTVNPSVRAKVAKNSLRENGYFAGETTYEVITEKKNPRKAKVSYTYRMNDPYTIDSIRYVRFRHRTDSILRQHLSESVLHVGDNFTASNLELEQERISALMRNNGFYYYRPEFTTFQADTFMHPGKVSLRVSRITGVPRTALRPYRIGDVSVSLYGFNNEAPTDSLLYKDLMIRYEGNLRVRPSVLYKRIRFNRGEFYSEKRQEKIQNDLSRLGIFKYSEMQFMPKDTSSRQDTLNVNINTAYDLPLDGELEVNATAKSNDQMGPGAIFSFTKRNLFGGGENFGVKLRGSYEWQTGNTNSGGSKVNSYEVGLSSSLSFPELLLPGFKNRNFDYPATTTFKVNVDQLNRARYFRLLSFGGSAQFDFQTSASSTHTFIPFRLTYNLLTHPTTEFDSLSRVNPALRISLQDQFIPSMGYTYTYDDSSIASKNDHIWWQTSISQAGNILSGIYALAGNDFSKREKKLFGNPFAQFVKMTSEIHYNHKVGSHSSLVGRLSAGIIYSYGNAVISPYNEQFYIGGANSVRAFTIRSIGPGRFVPNKDNRYSYIDQTGDLKFEANLEYRFNILGNLNGAAFLDGGNIWLLRDDSNRAGGQLKWSKFLNDLAVGTGMGLRYDMSFIVVRVDMGIGLHMPYDTGKSGYYNIPHFKDGLGIHLAVGYPF